MDNSWDERVAMFWSTANEEDEAATIAEVEALAAERDPGDPAALFERASAQDFVGRESEAIPLYRAALAAGLGGSRKTQAQIQLASSLRNIGDTRAAEAILQHAEPDGAVGAAAQAFLALSLRDLGRHDEALRVALEALAPTLPMYGHAVAFYAAALTAGVNGSDEIAPGPEGTTKQALGGRI
ncbi:tetratricopeptide repeat protein [Agromyces salentinus]|uniref:Tetratricopeptide repeat protein n=1 Tax=Agromyces salentinus TaxID=269421 RepID=A0ABN2MDN7_9MICO|nr:tetratricopeptide repeat protein [Agromyces salentinus]